MQLIIPPIEDDSTPQQGDHNMSRFEGFPQEGTEGSNNHGAISDELRQNFEAMKEIWRLADRESGADSAVLEELRHKERAQAIETALAVESEIAKWRMGIAELEAMLAADSEEAESALSYHEAEQQVSNDEQLGGGAHDFPVAAIRFPTLPPFVVPDDDENTTKDEIKSATSLVLDFHNE